MRRHPGHCRPTDPARRANSLILLQFITHDALARELLSSQHRRGARVRRSPQHIAAEIERYCAAHPEARDSIEGIAWWVAMQGHQDSLPDVREAVELLVARGSLTAYPLRDGSVVFGCSTAAGAKRSD
jgi:hypothetical protein